MLIAARYWQFLKAAGKVSNTHEHIVNAHWTLAISTTVLTRLTGNTIHMNDITGRKRTHSGIIQNHVMHYIHDLKKHHRILFSSNSGQALRIYHVIWNVWKVGGSCPLSHICQSDFDSVGEASQPQKPFLCIGCDLGYLHYYSTNMENPFSPSNPARQLPLRTPPFREKPSNPTSFKKNWAFEPAPSKGTLGPSTPGLSKHIWHFRTVPLQTNWFLLTLPLRKQIAPF